MAEVDARPWYEAKGLELGNWLRNKCPQRQFGGQAKVDGLVRTLTAAHERLEKAETDEERALAWAHVALDLEASWGRAEGGAGRSKQSSGVLVLFSWATLSVFLCQLHWQTILSQCLGSSRASW